MKRLFKTIYQPVAVAAILCALAMHGYAQTAATTQIVNQASATYSDGTNNYSSVSNQVTVTVAKVAGLTITPDGQTNSSVVPGQQNVAFTFRVTNVGNFSDQVRFLASGASVRVVGSATVASAVISGANTDILTNGADVLQTIAQNGYVDVVVNVNVSSSAAASSAIQVYLGDAASGTNFDNVAANSSTNEVRTVSTGAVNGSREARGDISVTVERDAQARVNLVAPAGPVALASNISYTVSLCNDGLRSLNAVSPATSIYVVAPVPAGTQLASGQTFATGTQFTTSALSIAPASATWVSSAPGVLSSVTRIRIPVATSVAAGACSSNFGFEVTVTTTNATSAIYEIVDVFANNSISTAITDQSGDSVVNKGDGNANFNEPLFSGTLSATQGFQLPTLLQKVASVLLGPIGAPNAVGPMNINDDYTNRGLNAGIAGVMPGGVTTAGGSVIFANSLQNTGNADDTFTLTAPTVPAGFTVEIATDYFQADGVTVNSSPTWTTVSSGGNVSAAVAFGQTKNIGVRVTAPLGKTVLTGYASTLRAVSALDSTKANNTIDRLYTGFVQLTKSFVIDNQTGVGATTDAVPGANIVYTIAYSNISSSGGTGNATLTVGSLVISEDGSAGSNNWATYTDQVVGSATDAGGTITGDATGSTVLIDTVASVAPGANGTFVFKRKIK